MKKIFVFLLLCLQVLSFVSPVGEALAAVPAKPTTNIYCQDYAHVLSPQTIRNIIAYSSAIDKKTTAQIAVVTIPSLEGASLEDYSLELFRTWGIGTKDKNNGVLLLIAVNDRKSRIEVGYGLEGALPDGLTGRIQDESMLPFFRQGNYDKGIWQGYGNIAVPVLKEYGLSSKDLQVQTSGTTPKDSASGEKMPWWFNVGLFFAFIILLIIDQMFLGGIILRVIMFMFLSGRGGGRGGGGFGGGFGGGSSGGGGSSRSW